MFLEINNDEIIQLCNDDIELNIKINEAIQAPEQRILQNEQEFKQSLTNKCMGTFDATDEDCQPGNPINYNSQPPNYITVIVDFGACDHVGPPSVCPHLPVEETFASKRQHYFQAGNGTRINNLSCKYIQAWTEIDDPVKMALSDYGGRCDWLIGLGIVQTGVFRRIGVHLVVVFVRQVIGCSNGSE